VKDTFANNGANDSVEPRAVSAAGEYTYLHFFKIPSPKFLLAILFV
jgi:hypothetical protein